MANFLIQTIDGQVRHDYSFALMEAIDYQNWLHKGSHEYELVDIVDMFEYDYSGFIPTGTIQFIEKFIATDKLSITPVNIPDRLWQYHFLKRTVNVFERDDMYFPRGRVFVKQDGVFKGYTKLIADIKDDKSDMPDGKYIVSDIVNIDSEWRCFVYKGELVGMQNYKGDFIKMPDVTLIKQMIEAYSDASPGYTLDVGVNDVNGTFLIEAHSLWGAVGYYGFSDSRIIPQMVVQSFKFMLKNGY